MQSRADKIEEYRQRQPVAELKRKADKSFNRANLWTQEQLDLVHHEAHELWLKLNGKWK